MTTKRKRLSAAQYVEKAGGICPCCGSDELVGDSVEIGGGEAWQEVSCSGCDAVWNDLYKLTGYDLLDPGDSGAAEEDPPKSESPENPPRFRAEGPLVMESRPGGEQVVVAAAGQNLAEAESTARVLAELLNRREETLSAIVDGAAIMGGFPQ